MRQQASKPQCDGGVLMEGITEGTPVRPFPTSKQIHYLRRLSPANKNAALEVTPHSPTFTKQSL